MFTIVASNRPADTLTVADTDKDEFTEITTAEYWGADRNLGLAVQYAKDRMAKALGRKGGRL